MESTYERPAAAPATTTDMSVGAWIGTIGIVLTMATGDGSAVTVAEHQPMKLAAMEGLYDGNSGQDLVAIGVLNPEKKVGDNLDPYIFEISLPKGLSILANHDKDSFVPGINDIIAGRSFSTDGKPVNTISYSERMERGRKAQSALRQFGEAKRQGDTLAMSQLRIDIKKHFNFLGYASLQSPSDAIPNIPLTFYSFRVMVGIGSFLLVFLLTTLFLAYKRPELEKSKWSKWFFRLAIISIPLTYICSVSGWVVAEVGRQPWIIQDLMSNSMAISDISAGYVQTTFCIFAVLFTALLIADISIMVKQIRKKSLENLNSTK